jgi:hypothetical protein
MKIAITAFAAAFATTLALPLAASSAQAQKAQQIRARLNCTALAGQQAKFGPFRRDIVLERTGDKLASVASSLTGPGGESFSGTVVAAGDVAVSGTGKGNDHTWSYELRGKRDDKKNTVLKGAATQTGTPPGKRACTMTLFKLRKT